IAALYVANVNSDYKYLLANSNRRYEIIQSAETDLYKMRLYTISLKDFAASARDRTEEIQQTKLNIEATSADFENVTNEYLKSLTNDIYADSELAATTIENVKQLQTLFHSYYQYTLQNYDFALKRAANEMISVTDDARIIGDQLSAIMATIAEDTLTDRQSLADKTEQDSGVKIFTFSCIGAFFVWLSITATIVLSSIILKPIRALVKVANNVSSGELKVNIDTSVKDEFGDLSRSFYEIVNNINNILGDIANLYSEHNKGNIDFSIDADKYSGSYKSVAVAVNDTIASYIALCDDVFAAVKAMAAGDFTYKLKKYEGKKADVNKYVDESVSTIKEIAAEITNLAESGAQGNLSARVDTSKYVGEWAKLLSGLNKLVDNMADPITESLKVLEKMAEGDLSTRIAKDYNGDFNALKTSVNNTIDSINSYILEIQDILSQMATGDLTHTITREYKGQFVNIKNVINSISSSLNTTMSEINSSSEQVLSGAQQISQSSMVLANGATEQSGSVAELTETIQHINAQTRESTKNAKTANEFSQRSKESAEHGNEQMQALMSAMEGIKASSNKISNIIKVIEEIATQTNLLALNASVEAARAGEHGKGFTVVASSVRDLAVQSQDAAKETSDLIQEAIIRVNEGVKCATETANSLEEIVVSANEVSDMMSKITNASQKQAESVGSVSTGITQISKVVQENSATSEQTAAAAQQLNSQSETLKSLVNFFKL
ncbi:MAG: methyl-accepting chemotaxis protein, partial [Clostridiales bacterium]|nr:methyl-accepting chemotaxis protein [Clostridiales bacterium]